MTLEELLAELGKLDRAQVIAGIQQHIQPVYQAIFDKGHSTSTAAGSAKVTQLEGQIAGLTEQIRTKDAEIQRLTDKTPEAAALRAQYEADLQKLQAKYKAKEDELGATLWEERKQRIQTDLRMDLIANGVDADYADVLVLKPEVQKRIRKNPETGQPEILQADSGVPLAAPSGKTPLHVLAQELSSATPAKFRTVDSDRGSDTTNGNGPSGRRGDFYAAIREDAKKRTERATEETQKSGLERLGAISR